MPLRDGLASHSKLWPLKKTNAVRCACSSRLPTRMSSSSKAVAVFFDAPHFDDYPFEPTAGNYYPDSYAELGAILGERGHSFYIVRGQETYRGHNIFSRGWKFDGTKFQDHPQAITVDRIYNKGAFVADEQARLLNSVEMESICMNKHKTYEMFPQLMSPSMVVHNAQEAWKALTHLTTGLIVAKPLTGCEGRGIIIASRETVARSLPSFPYLLQEFMDTSDGIPGLTHTKHDFRTVIINGEVIDAYIRIPKDGSLLANVAQGGSLKPVAIDAIPAEVLAILRQVEASFSMFGTRVYALDVCRQKNGIWKIIEINAQPGLPERIEPNFQRFLSRLTDVLVA